MKIRNGFVSNSSSASFVVIGKQPKECSHAQLTEEQAKRVIDYIEEGDSYDAGVPVTRSASDPVYLTQFLSDTGSLFHALPLWYQAYLYTNGGHGGPYDEEDYVCLDDSDESVYILKEHDCNLGTPLIIVGD